MANVFISYSTQNTRPADRLYDALKKAGHEVWIDREELKGGQRWLDEIQANILRAGYVVVLWSKQAVASRWVLDEIQFALSHNKTLIFIAVDDIKPSDHILTNTRQVLDGRGSNFNNAVLKTLGVMGTPPPSQQPASSVPPPRAVNWAKWGVIAAFLAVVIPALATVAVPFIERGLGEGRSDTTTTPAISDEASVVPTLTNTPTSTGTPTTAPTHTPSASITPTFPPTFPTPADDAAQLVDDDSSLRALNDWRTAQGLSALTLNNTLDTVAAAHASYLCRKPTFELDTANFYEDANGQTPQQMTSAVGYPGQTQMVVVVADNAASFEDLRQAFQGRNVDQSAYHEVGINLVKRDATQKVCIVLIVGAA